MHDDKKNMHGGSSKLYHVIMYLAVILAMFMVFVLLNKHYKWWPWLNKLFGWDDTKKMDGGYGPHMLT